MDHAATYWYNPHLHKKTNEHVLKGMAGLIIVRDSAEATINLPRTYGVDDFPLVIQTKAFDTVNRENLVEVLKTTPKSSSNEFAFRISAMW